MNSTTDLKRCQPGMAKGHLSHHGKAQLLTGVDHGALRHAVDTAQTEDIVADVHRDGCMAKSNVPQSVSGHNDVDLV